jgi:hypothetical protein
MQNPEKSLGNLWEIFGKFLGNFRQILDKL